MTASPAATKKDLDDLYFRVEGAFNNDFIPRIGLLIQQIVGDTVGEIVGDALQLISERFDAVDKRFDSLEKDMSQLHIAMIRVENKLDITADTTDRHTLQIKALQRKTA